MRSTQALIIGAGQAGLAMSRCLADRGVDHVVLERGGIAERWRSERWDSLRLLTPNWMTRLPGWSYGGDDPHGFMSAADFARYLESYASCSRAPVETGVTVEAVRRDRLGGYVVRTSGGTWRAGAVVIATGHCDRPAIPGLARGLPPDIRQLTSSDYRNPDQLPAEAGVLVVGAAATGVQLADEIRRSGRPVFLSVGRHIRLPRRYRDQDIWWWLERSGLLDDTTEEVSDLRRARTLASFQLAGRSDGKSLDLGALHARGVRLLGRLAGTDDRVIRFHDDLGETVGAAQAALERLLLRLDVVADAEGAPRETGAAPVFDFGPSPASLDLGAEGIRSVIWATGFVRDYGWLHVPGSLDGAGELLHDGGVLPFPGLYVIGLRFQRRRRSNLIDGVRFDAEDLSDHLLRHLARPALRAAA